MVNVSLHDKHIKGSGPNTKIRVAKPGANTTGTKKRIYDLAKLFYITAQKNYQCHMKK